MFEVVVAAVLAEIREGRSIDARGVDCADSEVTGEN